MERTFRNLNELGINRLIIVLGSETKLVKLTGQEDGEEEEGRQLHIDRFGSTRFPVSRSWYESSHFPTDTLF